jgi:hypothetical protein
VAGIYQENLPQKITTLYRDRWMDRLSRVRWNGTPHYRRPGVDFLVQEIPRKRSRESISCVFHFPCYFPVLREFCLSLLKACSEAIAPWRRLIGDLSSPPIPVPITVRKGWSVDVWRRVRWNGTPHYRRPGVDFLVQEIPRKRSRESITCVFHFPCYFPVLREFCLSLLKACSEAIAPWRRLIGDLSSPPIPVPITIRKGWSVDVWRPRS